MNEWSVGKDLEGSGNDLIEVLFRHLPEGLRKTTTNLSQNSRWPGVDQTEQRFSTFLTHCTLNKKLKLSAQIISSFKQTFYHQKKLLVRLCLKVQ
jgi:hypothetical protein